MVSSEAYTLQELEMMRRVAKDNNNPHPVLIKAYSYLGITYSIATSQIYFQDLNVPKSIARYIYNTTNYSNIIATLFIS